MKRTQSSMVMLALFVAVACTSTPEPTVGLFDPRRRNIRRRPLPPSPRPTG